MAINLSEIDKSTSWWQSIQTLTRLAYVNQPSQPDRNLEANATIAALKKRKRDQQKKQWHTGTACGFCMKDPKLAKFAKTHAEADCGHKLRKESNLTEYNSSEWFPPNTDEIHAESNLTELFQLIHDKSLPTNITNRTSPSNKDKPQSGIYLDQ